MHVDGSHQQFWIHCLITAHVSTKPSSKHTGTQQATGVNENSINDFGGSRERADNTAAASRRKRTLTWSLFLSRWRSFQPHSAAARPQALNQTLALLLPPSGWKPGEFAAPPGLHGWRWAGQTAGKDPRRWEPGAQCDFSECTPTRPRPHLQGEVGWFWSSVTLLFWCTSSNTHLVLVKHHDHPGRGCSQTSPPRHSLSTVCQGH